MKSKDARHITFGISKPTDMLRKLSWEIEQLRSNHGTQAYAYVTIDMATTAFHTLDWIACEITARNKWPFVISKFDLDLSEDAGETGRLKAIQRYAREDSRAMRLCEQIANASKHRDLRDLDGQIETFAEQTTSATDGTPLSVYFATIHGQEGTFMFGSNLIGFEARDWLERFSDQAGLIGANIPF